MACKFFIENKHFPPLQWSPWRTQCQHCYSVFYNRHLPIFCSWSGFTLSLFLLKLLLFCANTSLSVIVLYAINVYFLDLFWHLCFLVFLLLKKYSGLLLLVLSYNSTYFGIYSQLKTVSSSREGMAWFPLGSNIDSCKRGDWL